MKFSKLVHWLSLLRKTQSKMRNLGVIIDASLTFDSFVQSTVEASLFTSEILQDCVLNFSVAEKCINSFNVFWIDYCNALSKSTQVSSIIYKSQLPGSWLGLGHAIILLLFWSPYTGSRSDSVSILKLWYWHTEHYKASLLIIYLHCHFLYTPVSQFVDCSTNPLKIYGWQGFFCLCSCP